MADSSCAGRRAVVTLSLGSRPFVQHTRPLMAAYAARIGADPACARGYRRRLPYAAHQTTRSGPSAGDWG